MPTTLPQSARAVAPPGSAHPGAVRVSGLSKSFRLPHRRYHTLKERALHPLRRSEFDTLHAVRDVSFEVAEGEFFGIVGRNGSGKSTLLKCLAGIYDTDAGEIAVAGRLSPFIELGVGFNPDLTARDNVIINAIMLGLTRRQARERFDSIIAFAELEEFLDLKLKNYSSGMHVRLAFSVAIQVDADVVLIDEVLAVGDAAFQQKCFDEFHRMKDLGRTIVFVTHDMSAVMRFCDRAMILERGEMLEIGAPETIARRYHEINFGRLSESYDGTPAAPAGGAQAVVTGAWFEDPAGRRIHAVAQRERLVIELEIDVRAPLADPVLSVAVRNEARHVVFATSTESEGGPTGRFEPGERVGLRLDLPVWLAPGRYAVTATVARGAQGVEVLDRREDMASFIVHGTRSSGAIMDVPHELTVTRR